MYHKILFYYMCVRDYHHLFCVSYTKYKYTHMHMPYYSYTARHSTIIICVTLTTTVKNVRK